MDGYPPPTPTSNVFFGGEFVLGGGGLRLGVVEEVLGLFDWLTNTSHQTSNTSNRQIVVLPWVLSPLPPYTTKRKKEKVGPFGCMLSHLLACVNYHIFLTLFIIIFGLRLIV
jgi:hypothetical protein